MNKWFDSKNISGFAKTALSQAQKRIDQVLDIKEEDILNSAQQSNRNSISQPKSSIESSEVSHSRLNLNSSSSSNLSKNESSKTNEDTDSFFSAFLNQIAPTNVATSSDNSSMPTISSFSNFLNISPANSLISASSSDNNSSVTPRPSQLDEHDESTSATSSTATLDDRTALKPVKKSKPSRIQEHHQLQQQQQEENQQSIEQERMEKQNWIQNFVYSSDESNNNLINNKNNSSESSSLQTLSNNQTLVDLNIKSNFTDVDVDNKQASPTSEDGSYKIIESENSSSNRLAMAASSMTEIDFVKIEGNPSSAASGSSSTEEGLETCASSDIEVISLPSNHGDQLLAISRSSKVPTLAFMATKQAKNMDKSASQSQNSKNNPQSQSGLKSHIKLIKSPPASKENNNLGSSTNTADLQSINSYSNSSSTFPTGLLSHASDMRTVLDAREAHILKLNKTNVKLQEDNDNLLSDIEKLRMEVNEKCAFYQRAANEISQKYDQANNEREHLKRANNALQQELAEVRSAFKEREQQNEQLVQEGLKLSKQELNQSTIIKKLRAKEKEAEEVLNILKNDYQKSQKELEELKKVLDAKEEIETKNIEAFKKLEKTAIALEKELSNAKSSLEDSEEKVKSLDNTLQNTFRELAELHKANAAKDSKINQATNSLEVHLKEEIQFAVEKEKMIASKVQESLKWELQSARSDLTRIEQQHALREDQLRKEIGDIQQQLRDSENRNNELSQSIPLATRPLLRQIENLQSSHSSQVELLENAERNLIERLKEVQANLCEVTEKNRQNQEILIDLTQQNKTYEAQIQTLKLEKSKINAEYQMMKTNLENYENEKLEKEAKQKALIVSLNQQIDNLSKEKKYLENQLEVEKNKIEQDTKKFQTIINEFTSERELLLQQQRQHQQQQQQINNLNDKLLQNSPITSLPRISGVLDSKSGQRSSFDMSLQNSNGALNILETLQSKLKQKDGEIAQLQKEIHNLERIRESMAKELVNLSNKLETLQGQLKEFPHLQEKHNKLMVEYTALLTMYGEKSEETEELRMDLQDMKEMYKLQIEDLLKRSSA